MPNLNVGLGATPGYAHICDDCLMYTACNAQWVYFNEDMDESTVKNRCDYAYSDLSGSFDTQYFAKLGYNMGQALRNDMTNFPENVDITKYEASKQAYYQCGAIGFCDDIAGLTNRQYIQLHLDINTYAKNITIARTIETCPGDGLTNKDMIYNITACYISTFADTSGSGKYQDECHYSE